MKTTLQSALNEQRQAIYRGEHRCYFVRYFSYGYSLTKSPDADAPLQYSSPIVRGDKPSYRTPFIDGVVSWHGTHTELELALQGICALPEWESVPVKEVSGE